MLLEASEVLGLRPRTFFFPGVLGRLEFQLPFFFLSFFLERTQGEGIKCVIFFSFFGIGSAARIIVRLSPRSFLQMLESQVARSRRSTLFLGLFLFPQGMFRPASSP